MYWVAGVGGNLLPANARLIERIKFKATCKKSWREESSNWQHERCLLGHVCRIGPFTEIFRRVSQQSRRWWPGGGRKTCGTAEEGTTSERGCANCTGDWRTWSAVFVNGSWMTQSAWFGTSDVAKFFGLLPNSKQSNPGRKAPKTEGKSKYDDDDFHHGGCWLVGYACVRRQLVML